MREMLLAHFVWSNPTKYLQRSTLQMALYEGQVPDLWAKVIQPSLCGPPVHVEAQQTQDVEDQQKSEELEPDVFYDAPATPVLLEDVKDRSPMGSARAGPSDTRTFPARRPTLGHRRWPKRTANFSQCITT